MSAPVAFSAMITSVQRRANIDNQAGPILLPEIREYLNEGLTEFSDLLIEARGQEHCRKASSFNTVGNTASYVLPADFYELISVDIQIAPNQLITAEPYMERERNAFKLYPGWTFAGGLYKWYYRILGSTGDQNVTSGALAEKQINFIPTPQAAYTVTLNYVWRYPTFDIAGSQDTNVVNGVNGWEVYAVWWAVSACKNRLKEDATFALQRVAELKDRIQNLAPQNDAGQAERIQDVERDMDSFSWWR